MDNEILQLLKNISIDLKEIKESQKRMEQKLDVVYHQTSDLTENKKSTSFLENMR